MNYRQFAQDQLRKWGLDKQGWTFRVNGRLRKTLGRCYHSSKHIELSKMYLENGKPEHVKDTILHEIAHALAGPGTGHGREWKQWCRKVGAVPKARNKAVLYMGDKMDPKYVIHYKGKVVRAYFKKPRAQTFNQVRQMYVPNRMKETLGQLKLEPYNPQRHTFQ